MRFLAAVLVLANLGLYLMVNRLPEMEPVTAPEINLPRVTRIEKLDADRPDQQPPEAGSSCFMVGGFLTPTGSRNWMLLRGLPVSRHRIIRHGLVSRPVLAFRSTGDRPPFNEPEGSPSLAPRSRLIESGGKPVREFLFGDSGSLFESPFYRTENKRSFALESERVTFYSYAIVGGEGLRKAWSQRFAAGDSGNLAPESCESIAKQGQNP